MKPEICSKMLRNLSEKLRAKFPVTTFSYSMVQIAILDDAFSEMFELEASSVKVNHHTKKIRKGERGKKKKIKSLKK